MDAWMLGWMIWHPDAVPRDRSRSNTVIPGALEAMDIKKGIGIENKPGDRGFVFLWEQKSYPSERRPKLLDFDHDTDWVPAFTEQTLRAMSGRRRRGGGMRPLGGWADDTFFTHTRVLRQNGKLPQGTPIRWSSSMGILPLFCHCTHCTQYVHN